MGRAGGLPGNKTFGDKVLMRLHVIFTTGLIIVGSPISHLKNNRAINLIMT